MKNEFEDVHNNTIKELTEHIENCNNTIEKLNINRKTIEKDLQDKDNKINHL